MIDLNGKRFAYTIVEESRDTDGGYIPCVAVENEQGYSPMSGNGPHAAPWNWGKDRKLANQICEKKNQELGLSIKDAFKIVCSSMFPKKR
jgi:hypothetical protein